jgi:hypothetical protein
MFSLSSTFEYLLFFSYIMHAYTYFSIITMAACTMAALAGGIFLHPDFGVDKTNKMIRYA